jgi:hypothetical protein
MGLHRSGTTILYKILSKTLKFNVLTAYHILDFDRLIYNYDNNLIKVRKNEINDLFKQKNITNRKIDKMKVTADYVHEYCYIFSKKNYNNKLNNKNKQLFDLLCKKLTYLSKQKKPVLLKNPYDFNNFLFIKNIYPNAKFIFIHRNPLKVIDSTMRSWHTLLKNKNDYTAIFSKRYDKVYNNPLSLFLSRLYYDSPIPVGLIEVINRCSNGTNYYLRNIKEINSSDYISIKYEELCYDPNLYISNILKFLNIKSQLDFSKYISPRKIKINDKVNLFNDYIKTRMKPYFKEFNYQ